MAEKKTTAKKTTKSNKSRWGSTGGALKPVDLNKVQFANKPTKK